MLFRGDVFGGTSLLELLRGNLGMALPYLVWYYFSFVASLRASSHLQILISKKLESGAVFVCYIHVMSVSVSRHSAAVCVSKGWWKLKCLCVFYSCDGMHFSCHMCTSFFQNRCKMEVALAGNEQVPEPMSLNTGNRKIFKGFRIFIV